MSRGRPGRRRSRGRPRRAAWRTRRGRTGRPGRAGRRGAAAPRAARRRRRAPGSPARRRGQPLAGQTQRLLVAVETDQADLGEAGEQSLAVAAQAQGAVDDHRVGPLQGGRQQVQTPLEHHGDVSAVAQEALSGPASRTHRPVPGPLTDVEDLPAPRSVSRPERVEAEPYVRAAHVGRPLPHVRGLRVKRSAGRAAPPASRHFSPPCRPVNQPACASSGRVSCDPDGATDAPGRAGPRRAGHRWAGRSRAGQDAGEGRSARPADAITHRPPMPSHAGPPMPSADRHKTRWTTASCPQASDTRPRRRQECGM